MLFSNLPKEIKWEVFSFLNPMECFGSAALVSREWYVLAQQVSYSVFIKCYGEPSAKNAAIAAFWKQYEIGASITFFGSTPSLIEASSQSYAIFKVSLHNLLNGLTNAKDKRSLANLISDPKAQALSLCLPMTAIQSVQSYTRSATRIYPNPYFLSRYWWVTDTTCHLLTDFSWDFLDRKEAAARASLQLTQALDDDVWPKVSHGYLVDCRNLMIPPVYQDRAQDRYAPGCAIPAYAIVGFFKRAKNEAEKDTYVNNPGYRLKGIPIRFGSR